VSTFYQSHIQIKTNPFSIVQLYTSINTCILTAYVLAKLMLLLAFVTFGSHKLIEKLAIYHLL